MTDSWKCATCQKDVPAGCDGKCGTGTTAERTTNK